MSSVSVTASRFCAIGSAGAGCCCCCCCRSVWSQLTSRAACTWAALSLALVSFRLLRNLSRRLSSFWALRLSVRSCSRRARDVASSASSCSRMRKACSTLVGMSTGSAAAVAASCSAAPAPPNSPSGLRSMAAVMRSRALRSMAIASDRSVVPKPRFCSASVRRRATCSFSFSLTSRTKICAKALKVTASSV